MQGGAPGLDGVPDLAAPGEQDQVVRSHAGRKALDEGPAEALVGARDEIDATARELSGLPEHGGTVRLGWVPSAGTTLVPHALAALRRSDPGPHVISREGGTPALARALRAGSIDLALPASAPPPGVRILPVRGGPQELRRLLLARLPPQAPVQVVAMRLPDLGTDAEDAVQGVLLTGCRRLVQRLTTARLARGSGNCS